MRILVADDNHFYRVALKGMLADWGYEVIEAKDGNLAWDILKQPEAPKLAILDWMMPGLSGPELCKRLRALNHPEPTYVIILTNLDGKENSLKALHAGADDFIHKPFDREQLQARLAVGRRIVNLQTSQTVVYSLARAVEAKSPYTKGHADRVTHYALGLAASLGLSEADLNILRHGGILHDLGKISIPDAILNKPGPLTREEFDVIKRHPELGVEILQPLHSLKDMLPLVRWHHERMDGNGYPDKLKADQIPRLVRILSVADHYDALNCERPYRPAIPHHQCLDIMKKDAAEGGLEAELVARFANLPAGVFERIARGFELEFFHSVPGPMPLTNLVQEMA